MPHIKVYIHFVWSTKNRIPFLNSPELRKKVWQHIAENARSSVSESALNKVRDYIKNQEEHHRKRSFKDEYEDFLKIQNFEKPQNKDLG